MDAVVNAFYFDAAKRGVFLLETEWLSDLPACVSQWQGGEL